MRAALLAAAALAACNSYDPDLGDTPFRCGTDEPPAWYLNLSDEPQVEVQIKGDRFKAHARTASAEEKPEMWKTMVSEWPAYDEYQEKTEREIPVVVLERD